MRTIANHDDTDLSIITPAYNEEALILSTLDSLQAYVSACEERYDVAVVDGGSQNKTVTSEQAWQKESGIGLRMLVNQKNMVKGFSVQRNVGAVEYIALILSHLSRLN